MEKYYQAYDKRYQQIHNLKLQWSSDVVSPILQELIVQFGIRKTDKILEIGCGEGRDALWLLEQGYDVLATDVSKEAISYCKKKNSKFSHLFFQLDVCEERLPRTFKFIYSIAVIHMLVNQEDRNRFLTFIRDHLDEDGYGLILTMGDGECEVTGDITSAFDSVKRTHQGTGQEVAVAATSCRMVNFATLEQEIAHNGLQILQKGITSIIPDFPQIMYALVKRSKLRTSAV